MLFVRVIQIFSAEKHFLERLALKGNLEIYKIWIRHEPNKIDFDILCLLVCMVFLP